jgi:hypothetical protein
MNILNLKTNIDSTGAVENLFFIAPNVWWLGEVPPCTNVEL